ncbi:MAG: TonB-dependent receptor [Lacunisphaera sp.]|nr:TonB-dependent receptor [Lacunisphaera sp.]
MNSSHRPELSVRKLVLAHFCLLLGAATASAQTTAPSSTAPEPAPKNVPVVVSAEAPAKDETLVLSPFEVVANNKGYYSANTMSGTRFNTKLDDLASSITVMTKEQMADFGMLDVNDVFLYVAGTEGTGTYTDYTLDRNGSLGDNVQNNPTSANRVRGIAPANISLGNIETMGRVPVDPLSIDSLEVSRGPNANVFGLGNPSGTVNQVPASANLTRNRASTTLRADSYDGSRATLDLNQVLIKGRLAVRGSAVYQQDRFERKPSGVDTERYNAMIKYQPFKYTTISGSMNYYHAYGNRPNALPPRDNLSYWLSQGSPTWDPVTQQIHNSDGSPRGAPVTATTYNGPDVFNAGYLGNNHGMMFIDQTGLSYWSTPQATSSTTSPVGTTLQAARYLQTSAVAGAVFSGTAPRPFAQYLFNTTPTISDKGIYDWSSINLSAPNSFWDKTATWNANIDQMILNTPTQTLAAQFSFMREDSERWTRNLVGTANDNGQSGQLMVDINERRLDGSVNPFFLRPYLSVDKPRTQYNPQKWDTTRAQLAYRLDLTEKDNFLKHLGWFQLTGYGEYKYRVNRQYSYRDAIASPSVAWIPAGTYRGTQSNPTGTPAIINLTQGLYRYYVGDKTGNNVDYAPGSFSFGTYPFVWGNAATGAFTTDNLLLAPVAADKSGGTFNTKTTLKTIGGVMQNHLLSDRLVVTLGARYDQVSTQFGNPGNPVNNYINADGITFNYDATDGWAAARNSNGGRTTNVQFVARPFVDTPVVSKLNSMDHHFVADLLSGLSVNANRSNSFLPLNPAQDLFKNILPNPTGTDKSWGLGLNLFDGKLVIRATRYDNLQKNSQNNDINTMAGRVLRVDFLTSGAGSPTPSHNLYTNAVRWVTFANPTWTTDQITAEVQRQTKFSTADNAYYSNATPPIAATTDIRSVGTEIEVNYNPTRFWTVSGSVTDTKSMNQNISKALVDWINLRLPVWTTAVDPSISDANALAEGNPGKLWWLHHYTQSGTASLPGTAATFTATAATPQDNYNAFVAAPFGIIRAQEGKTNPQVRRYAFRASTSYKLAGFSDNKVLKSMTIGGALRWEDKGAIGYYGLQSLPAIITDLDPNRPIYDKAHYYVDAFVTYKTKLWRDKVGASFQFNVKNLGEGGRLQPVGAFPDGTIHTFRIVDPQQFILSASFDL